jgi:hypothetical protein
MKRVKGFAGDRPGAQGDQRWSFLRLQWKRIGLTVVAGMFVGFAAAAGSKGTLAMHQRMESPSRSVFRVPQENADEVSRLKVRNRRLEALVTVLQHRAAQRE